MEDAVDAVADVDARGLRFDVYVARPHLDRFDQNFIHEPNDRRFLRFLGQFGIDVDLIEKLNIFFVLQGEQIVDRFAADAQVGLDLPGNLIALG